MHAFEHEAGCIAAHPIAGFNDFDICKSIAGKSKRCADPSGSSAQNRNLGHAPILCDRSRSGDLADIIHRGFAPG
jgi:hypothetical protein